MVIGKLLSHWDSSPADRCWAARRLACSDMSASGRSSPHAVYVYDLSDAVPLKTAGIWLVSGTPQVAAQVNTNADQNPIISFGTAIDTKFFLR